jgi:hypothetical protein
VAKRFRREAPEFESLRIRQRKVAPMGQFPWASRRDQMNKPFIEEELSKVLANSFYCLRSVHPIFTQDHDTLVSEEQWVKASANLIREIGAEKFLRLLLENLKGNYF